MTFSSMVEFIHCFQNSCAYSRKLEPSLKVSTVLKKFVTPKISAMISVNYSDGILLFSVQLNPHTNCVFF